MLIKMHWQVHTNVRQYRQTFYVLKYVRANNLLAVFTIYINMFDGRIKSILGYTVYIFVYNSVCIQ